MTAQNRPWFLPDRLARVALLLFLLPFAALAACEEFGDGLTGNGDDEPTVEGTWETTDGDLQIYVRITTSAVTVAEGVTGGCFTFEQMSIVSRDGDIFTLEEAESSETFQVTIRIEGDQLRVQSQTVGDEFNLLFDASTQDLGALEVCSIEGTWVYADSDAGYTEYLEITSSSVTVYSEDVGGCFTIVALDIVSQNGDVFTMRAPDGTEADLIVRLEAGQLVLADPQEPENEWYYNPSNVDVSTLEECEPRGSGGDPAIACSDLPAIDVGQSITGELSTSDSQAGGWYYDLYGLTLSSAQEVQIDLTSTQIDTYMLLYAGDGSYITENDDVGDSLNSQIIVTLDAGCYRIEASSYDMGETGSYTLSVN